jgi:uncharacterized protein YbjQ (UPF0145 family)
MHKNKFLITTTSHLEGYSVNEYLGPISHHIVVGTNIFSDIAASITDMLGGKSSTYQKKLSLLFDEAIYECKRAAQLKGANCILAYRVDVSEITGGSKQMFMISANGTAAIINRIAEETKFLNNNKIISIEDLSVNEARDKIIEKYGKGEKIYEPDTWTLIKQYKFYELFESQLKFVEKYDSSIENSWINSFRQYIDFLPEDIQKSIIYKALHTQLDKSKSSFLIDIIIQNKLFDAVSVISLLKHDSLQIRKYGVKACTSDSRYYSVDDVHRLECIAELLNNSFPTIHKKVFGKTGILSSKEIEMWECSCGVRRPLHVEYCSDDSCGENSYGFKKYEPKPYKLIEFIIKRVSTLNKMFEIE